MCGEVARILTVSIAFALCANADAKDSEEEALTLAYGDQTSITIATGSKQALRHAPAVATVITAQDMAAMGASDVDTVLESVAGLHVSRANLDYIPLYLIRGIHSTYNPQTLVLLNGVPMTTLFIGNRGVGGIDFPLHNVARIEVIRGPGSALYGADAYSGVINIVTLPASDKPGTEAGVRIGSFHTRDGWIRHAGRSGDLEFAAYFRAAATAGHKSTIEVDAQTGLDQVFGTRASLAPGSVHTGYEAVDAGLSLDYGKWRLHAYYKLRDKVGTGAGVAAALDPVGSAKAEHVVADLSWADLNLAPGWGVGVTGSYAFYTQYHHYGVQLFPPGAFGGAFPNGMVGAPNTWERQLRFSVWGQYSGFRNHRLRIGIGHDDLDLYRTQERKNFTFITSGPLIGLPIPTPGAQIVEFPVDQSFLAPHRRKLNYFYVQDEWRFARDWTFTGGIRRDSFSDFGSVTNPRLALVWDAAFDLTVKLLYGAAFRAPAFNELYSINNPVDRGNLNLRPETIRTTEAVLSWQASQKAQVNLSAFRYTMKDIIRAMPDASPGLVTSFRNAGNQNGHGFELEGVWNASWRLRFSGHYAWQRSTDVTTNRDAGYAPHCRLFVRADWRFGAGWIGSAQMNRVAGRERAAGDNRPPVSDYTTFDIAARNVGGETGWEFTIGARNLFKADAREPSLAPGSIPNDLPTMPRTVYLQAAYRM